MIQKITGTHTFRMPLWLSSRFEVLRSLCMIQLSWRCATPRNNWIINVFTSPETFFVNPKYSWPNWKTQSSWYHGSTKDISCQGCIGTIGNWWSPGRHAGGGTNSYTVMPWEGLLVQLYKLESQRYAVRMLKAYHVFKYCWNDPTKQSRIPGVLDLMDPTGPNGGPACSSQTLIAGVWRRTINLDTCNLFPSVFPSVFPYRMSGCHFPPEAGVARHFGPKNTGITGD